LDRRRFLKYASVTAAVVGASALGLNYVSQQSPSMMSPTTSTTLMPRLRTTSASLTTSAESSQLVSLQGRLFFDYNGNGKQDGEEPAITGASVQLKDTDGKVIAETLADSSGDYRLDDVRTGPYTLHVEADKKFRYMCDSPNGFAPLQQGWYVPLRQGTTLNLGLMEGFLTSPVDSISIGRYYDRDSRTGHVMWWNGKQYRYTNPAHGGWDDDHTGTDFDAPYRTPVFAAASGVVVHAGLAGDQAIAQGDLSVDVSHGHSFYTDCHHFSKILVSQNQAVKRGDIIGLVGSSGTFYPHVHFEIYTDSGAIYDPFKPILPLEEKSSGYWWATPTSKHWVSVSLAKNPNLLGYWTKADDPIPPG